LVLDEIADADSALQIALLRVIEEREVTPVGSTRPRAVDLRVLAATHEPLIEAVHDGTFRADLYHRLHIVGIRLPSLRERRDDIPLLATHLLSHMEGPPRLHPESLRALMDHDWPGNVRELHNVLQAASLLSDDAWITPDVLERILESRPRTTLPRPGGARLGPQGEAALGALADRWLSAPEIATSLGVSPRTANRVLRRLVERGFVVTHGEARARRYRSALMP
jgi:DNA-binding NtrC family response regulator